MIRQIRHHPWYKYAVKLVRLGCGAIAALVLSLTPFLPFRWPVVPAPAALAQSVTSEPVTAIETGRDHYQNGQYAAAAAAWRDAIATFEANGDRTNLARTWTYLALAQKQLGELDAAIEAIETSLDIASSLGSPERASFVAPALNTQGSILLTQGQADAALQAWQQATEAYTQADDPAGRIGSTINQSQAQQALGLYHQARQTLVGLEEDLLQLPNPQLRCLGLLNLGNVLRLAGDLQDSRRVLRESLEIATDAPEGYAIANERSRILTSLGNVERAGRDLEAAQGYYQEAIAIAPSPTARVRAQLNQLDLAIAEGRGAETDALWREIQTQLETLPRSRAAADARIQWTSAMTRLRVAEAIDLPWTDIARVGSTAIEIARDLGDVRAESYALGTLGALYERADRLNDAQRLTERALLLAQSTYAPDIAYQWQWQLGRILKARGQYDAAIGSYSVAYDTLQSLRRDLVAINPDVQFTFRDRVEPVYREYVDLLLQEQPDSIPGEPEFQRAREAIEALQLAELDNFFRSACLDAQVVPIEAVDRSGTAVLYPIILSDRVEVILSLPDAPLQHYAAAVEQAQVEKTLSQLRIELAQPYTSPESMTLAQQVYDWLLRPAAADLEQSQVKTLAFVLDGKLRDVPMAALYDGDRYLVESYAVALAPGLQLIAPQPLETKQLQALTAGLTQSRHGFSPLAYVSSELTQIEEVLPSRSLVDEAFTTSTLADQIADLPFPIVHLATHGQFSSNADETFVLAWDKPIQVKDFDTLLRRRNSPDAAAEAAIELLVLSACDTAAGDDRATLGLAGLALRAGARSTLASLWALDDESGARLMGQFYRELAQSGISKAEALRRAQLTMLDDPDYRHPIHWSPFVLVGNWL